MAANFYPQDYVMLGRKTHLEVTLKGEQVYNWLKCTNDFVKKCNKAKKVYSTACNKAKDELSNEIKNILEAKG